MSPLAIGGIVLIGLGVFAVVMWLVMRETGTRVPSITLRPAAPAALRRFRVKGIDVATREPAEFSEFEAKDRADVLVRLSGVGIEVRSIEEVPWVDLRTETRAADVAAEDSAGRESVKAHLTAQRDLSGKRLAARKIEREAYDAPRQRVLMDLSWHGFFGIMFAVALGIPLSAVITALGIGVLAEIGKTSREAEARRAMNTRFGVTEPSAIEYVVLVVLVVIVVVVIWRWAKKANWFKRRLNTR